MPPGGKRTGTPGKAYSNRVDLNEAPSGGEYGETAARQARVDAVPMAPPAPRQITPPAAFDRPTERPMEPLTAGLDIGPGPGSEALGMAPADNLEKLRPMLPVLELLAGQPGVGVEARNLVRRLRGGLG